MAIKPVMLVRPPLGILLDDGFWDELDDAGINEVAIQWLALLEDRGGEQTRYPQIEDTHPRAMAAVGGSPVQRTPVAAYDPNTDIYEGLLYSPPLMPESLKAESTKLKLSLQRAVDRGFTIWTVDDKGYFLSGGFGDGSQRQAMSCVNDPDLAGFAVTRARDTSANFPCLGGMILDGPDFKWEIKPGHRDDMFVEKCGCRHCQRVADSIGISYERVLEGRDAFGAMLHSLTPAAVDDFLANYGGAFGGLDWWLEEPAIADWMRYKATVIEQHLRAICTGIREYLPDTKLATSSRMPALAPITGHIVRRKSAFRDYEMPKLYWWFGGVAGFRGTAANWVDTLMEWNTGLSRDQATGWFSTAFDVPFPDDYRPSDYGSEAPDSFFDVTVDDQIRKMLAAAGGAKHFMPWVGLEHFGSQWVTPSELRRMLATMERHGVERYSFFVYNSITPEIWSVITEYSRK